MVLWALSGLILGLSDTWRLIINTRTTTMASQIVFIIQYSPNWDDLAPSLKLEALVLDLKTTNSKLFGAEEDIKRNSCAKGQ
ncbi:hypothetical protein CVS27_16185 [Arthrobacter glacialis]|uniref:Uncharacterized protein n=1 Tax=Arthrobacter glacialis TaxID=1664 RepID=A0A2S3ZT87_ARTGL|nr:hypothetical protein CVS27_16185 [Arthrobacter glacialis]